MRLPRREAAAEKNEVFCMIIQNALVYTPRHTFERGTPVSYTHLTLPTKA